MLSEVAEAVLTGSSFPVGGDPGPYTTKTNEQSLHEECLLWGARVIVPESIVSQVLKVMHTGHPSIEKSKMIARSDVWWPEIDNNVKNQMLCLGTSQLSSKQQNLWSLQELLLSQNCHN
ncbi:hypothetical protein MRX96_035089 [Rhipicephalus microplus]